jgi:outer membrane protein assembly factor BamB
VNIRAWAAGLILVLLTACGGGGTSSNPPLSASASPASADLTSSTTGGLPSERISVVLAGTLTSNVTTVVVGSAKGYATAIVDATGTVVIFGIDPGLLAAGTYTDTLSVNVCYDDQCQRPAIASPVKIPVSYTVTQGDPSTVAPKITDTVPASAPVGSADLELTIDGTNFTPSSFVYWNNQVLPATYVSVHRLTVMVPASDLAVVATVGIEVSNQPTGGGASATQTFQVRGPVPTVSSLSPATAGRDGSAFLLTLDGTGFDSTSQVTWNGDPVPTAFVSPTRVTAQIGIDHIAAAGAFPIGVYNVDGGSITSNTMTVTVADAPLSVTSLVPSAVTAGGPAYLQTVTGTGFDATSTLQFNGSPRATTVVSTTRIVAQLSAADVAGIGSAVITVTNGGTNPATSGPLTLTMGAASTDATAWQINPQHNGAIRFANIVGPTALPTLPAWTAQLDGIGFNPLIAGGRVFIPVVASGEGQLVALSAATGAVLWGPVSLPWPISGATYDNGRVIAVSGGGQMSAFDAATGTLLWSTLLTGQPYFTSPTAANGIVFVGGAGFGSRLYAVNDATGGLMWTREDGDGSEPTVTADGVYVSYPCHAHDFQPATGETVWFDDGDCTGGSGGRGMYANGVYYSPDSLGPTTGRMFDAETGSVLSDYTGKAALGSSMGYFIQWSGTLKAVDLASGTARWTFAGDGNLVSQPILVNSYVFVESDSGKLYALDAVTGTQLWSTSLGSAFDPSLSVSLMTAGNGLLLVPLGKSLVAYTLSNNP